MRLNKYIAAAGIASRRKADQLIKSGQVQVNGVLLTSPGYDVAKEDLVQVRNRIIEPVKKQVYIMLNKPKGYISTVEDDRGRPTVMDLVGDFDRRLFPVGRLDYNSSGLLLLTSDGDFAFHMTHPSHQIEKTYRAKVGGTISDKRLAQLRNGVDIGGFITSPAQVRLLRQMRNVALVEIVIKEGRNRQIRKMFASVGNKVLELERIAIAGLYLGHLKEGHYRKLTLQEVESLRSIPKGGKNTEKGNID